jgi:hypothetical protein
VIARHDAALGVAQGTNGLDNGFFRVRWDRATRAEQSYLRAMAIDRDEGSSSKGLIYAPEHGIVAFTVPGMAAFIGRQIDS